MAVGTAPGQVLSPPRYRESHIGVGYKPIVCMGMYVVCSGTWIGGI